MREDESMLIEGTVGPWRRYALDLRAIRVFSKGMGVRWLMISVSQTQNKNCVTLFNGDGFSFKGGIH